MFTARGQFPWMRYALKEAEAVGQSSVPYMLIRSIMNVQAPHLNASIIASMRSKGLLLYYFLSQAYCISYYYS
jgi:hypothetical protein